MQNAINKLRITRKGTSFMFAFISFLLLSVKLNAQSISSGVTFHWEDVQNNVSEPATIKSITINGKEYNSFVVPSSYKMTRVGHSGHSRNRIKRNGSTVIENSSSSNWQQKAEEAYQSLNLNHYFESASNGDDLCNSTGQAISNKTQIQTISFSPGIPSNEDGIIGVTERGGNNCLYVELYGKKGNGNSEELLGYTLVKTGGDLRGVGPQAAPTNSSDYWRSGRNNENDQVIGIALFELSKIAPIGSIITSIRYSAATEDHGDGKFFLMQSYAVDDIFETEFDQTLNGNIELNDNVPEHSTYTLQTSPTPINGSLQLNTNGTFSYTPNAGFVGTEIFEIEMCLPAPNQSVCETSTLTITVLPNNLPTAVDDYYTIEEDVVNNVFNMLSNDDFGLDGPKSNNPIRITQSPAQGTALLNDNGTDNDPLDDYISYTPNPNFNGKDEIHYEIIDGNGSSSSAIIHIQVNPDTSKNIKIITNGITVDESVGMATITVQITGNYQVGPTISYTTLNNTAIAGEDYLTITNTHVFEGNNNELFSFQVPIIDDNFIEVTEIIDIEITSPSYPTAVRLATTINIIDNDNGNGSGISFFNNDDITVDESAGTATVNVLLTGNIPGGFTLDYTTTDATAFAPGDYTTTSGQLTFVGNDGETQPITVTIIDDNLIETLENLVVDLSNISTNLIYINDDQATINIVDNDGGTGTGISFDSSNVTVDESAGTATVNVVLTGNIPGGFTLDYTTTDATAFAPGDYTTTSGQLTFVGNDGETQPITVTIIDDNLIETLENLVVDLSNISTNLIYINDDQATINIVDNDGGVGTGISFNNDNITVDESAGTATVNVLLTGNVPGGFTLDYTTTDASAVAPGDYTTTSGQLTFAGTDGETQPINVPIIDDNLIEALENLLVDLSNLSTGLISINDNQATVNITDNDGGVGTGISFDNDNITVDESAGTATVNVLLTGNVPGGFTLDYTTTDATAVAPGDYTTTSGQLTFAGTDGETQPITVPIIDDNLLETLENLLVDLSNLSTNLIYINDNQATINILDNDGLGAGEGISVADFTVDEDAGTADFVIT
ncbi:Calx-beta domain-containing protein, partial [Maribacter chungangensis]